MEQQILSISLKEYKAQIDSLRASLLQLEKGSKQYESTVNEIKQKQQSLNEVMAIGKRDTDALEGSYNALQQQMTALKKEWKATNDEAKRNDLAQQISVLDEQLKGLDASVGQFQRNVGNYAIAGESMKSQLKSLKEEIAQLSAQGVGPADERMQELIRTAGALQDAMGDASAMIKQAANDTSTFATIIDVAKTGTAVFGAWQGALAAFGVENDAVVKSIQQLQGIMTMLNSLQQIQTALVDKSSATYQLWNKALQAVGLSQKSAAVASQELTVSEKAQATATNTVTASTTKASVAMGVFKKALISTGIGAIVVLLGTLIANLDKVGEWIGNLVGRSNDYSQANEQLEASIEAVNNQTDNEIKVMKAQGASESQIIKYKQKKIKEQIKEVEGKIADIKATNKQIESSNKWYKAITKAVKYATTAMTGFLQPVLYAFDKIFGTNWSSKFSDMTSKIGKSVGDWAFGIKDNNKEIEELQATLKKLNGTMTDYNYDLQAATIAEKKKAESTKSSTKTTEDNTDAINENVIALKTRIAQLREDYSLTQEYMQVRGTTGEKQYNKLMEFLGNEREMLLSLQDEYKNVAESAKKGSKEQLDALKNLADVEKQLRENTNKVNLAAFKQEQDARKKDWEDAKKNIENRKQLFNDINFEFDQIAVGQGSPIIDAYLKRINGDDKGLKIAIGEQIKDINKTIKDELSKKNIFGDWPIDKNALADKYKKYLEGEEKSILDEWTEFPREKNRPSLEFSLEIAANEQQFNERESYYQNTKALYMEHLSTLEEGSQEYLDTQEEINRLEMESERNKTEYIIAQQDLLNKKRKEDKKSNKEYAKAVIKDTTALQSSFGNLMGAIGDIMMQNLERKKKNGEISEEEAEKEFERVKKVQAAQLWISTLAGATGAFVNDMGSYAWPFNMIIAGIDLATTLAAGVAQHRSIMQQTMDSAASGSGGAGAPSIQDVQVAPLLNERADYGQLTAMSNQDVANNTGGDQRVFILQSDLEKSGQQVQIRQTQSTF